MSDERGMSAVLPSVRPGMTGLIGLLVLIDILRLVILLGWRDGGRPIE